MNTSINYSDFIDIIQNSHDDIDFYGGSEITEVLKDNRALLELHLSGIDDIDHSYDM